MKIWRRGEVARGSVGGLASFTVETFLLPSARIGSIVLPATRIGSPTTMVLPAAKGAAEILAARVAGMREEAYAAVTTPHRAGLQIRTIAQDGIQREMILTNKRNDPVVLMPIFAKREIFRDGYYKIARFSVKILIGFCMTSSYSFDAKASRGRARFFYAAKPKRSQVIRATDLFRDHNPIAETRTSQIIFHVRQLKRLLGKKKHTVFRVGGQSKSDTSFFFPSRGVI